MTTTDSQKNASIATMPRGGPDASWLNRRLQTDVLEYTDRYDIPDEIKQKVITELDRLGDRNGLHEQHARTALSLVAGDAAPKILELGAGHGKLSAAILDMHPTATVTVSDLDPTSVANIDASTLGRHPRATTAVIDATAIDAPDDTYDLVILAAAFHHLPPVTASRAIAEATRVGKQFLVVDIQRPSTLALLAMPVLTLPIMVLTVPPRSLWALLHDASISMLRSYSRSAFHALARAADPAISVEFLRVNGKTSLAMTAVVFER